MLDATSSRVDSFFGSLVNEFAPPSGEWDPTGQPVMRRLIELESRSVDEYCGEVSMLAQQRGWSISPAEVASWRVALTEEALAQRNELTDAELELVAGGAGSGTGSITYCSGTSLCKNCCVVGKSCKTCLCPKTCI